MNTLEQEVKEEVDNPLFITKRHGTRACYRAGCRGPLCKRSERIIRRRYRDAAREPYQNSLDQLLLPLQEQHNQEFKSREKASA